MKGAKPATPDIHLVKSQEKDGSQCDGYMKCLCAGVDPEAAARFKPLVTQAGPFLENDLLVRRGDKFNAFYIVQSGVLRSETVSISGRRKVKWFYFPGDLIGMEAMSSGQWPADLAVVKTTSACKVSVRVLAEAAQHCPPIQQQMFSLFGERILDHEYSLATDFSEAAKARVLDYVLKLYERLQGTEFVSGSIINLPMTKTELASYLGMTPETLSRILNRLEAEDLIVNQPQSIDLRDRARLQVSLEYAQR